MFLFPLRKYASNSTGLFKRHRCSVGAFFLRFHFSILTLFRLKLVSKIRLFFSFMRISSKSMASAPTDAVVCVWGSTNGSISTASPPWLAALCLSDVCLEGFGDYGYFVDVDHAWIFWRMSYTMWTLSVVEEARPYLPMPTLSTPRRVMTSPFCRVVLYLFGRTLPAGSREYDFLI